MLTRIAMNLFTLMRGGAALLREAVSFLASTESPCAEEDRLNSAMRGGNFNHRIGQFDDGTDPVGWYERE
jgi:hypothetical protein